MFLLVDRGFVSSDLICWLTQRCWHWAIRAKYDLNVTLANGLRYKVTDLIVPKEDAYLFHRVTSLEDIECDLAMANLSVAGESWMVLSDIPASVVLLDGI